MYLVKVYFEGPYDPAPMDYGPFSDHAVAQQQAEKYAKDGYRVQVLQVDGPARIEQPDNPTPADIEARMKLAAAEKEAAEARTRAAEAEERAAEAKRKASVAEGELLVAQQYL